MKQFFCSFLMLQIFSTYAQNAQDVSLLSKPKIWVSTMQGDQISGVMVSTTDTSLLIFPGKRTDYKAESNIQLPNHHYKNIVNIRLKKKGGILKGILIGAGIGISPLLLSSAFGRGEGGAYISVATFPVGIITGAIIGGTSKKKFLINGNANRYNTFRKSMK